MHLRSTIFQSIAHLSKTKFDSKKLLRTSNSFIATRFSQSCNNIFKCLRCKANVKSAYNKECFYVLILYCIRNIPVFIRGHSERAQNCMKSIDLVQQISISKIISLCTKLWNESSLCRTFTFKFKPQVLNHKIFFLMGSSIVSNYDWSKERITDDEILRYSAEISLVEFLRDKRKACLNGNNRPTDCKCSVCTATDSEWQSFVEEDDIIVWKREDVNHRGKGLYCYKMYARYEDVTAYDFLEAQIDLEYRRLWDIHAVELRLIDSEPSTNSDVIYWETKWPKLFSNRDYVFKRRYRIDKKRNLIYMVNRITEHPSCPVISSKQRISEYWSYMIIKPHTTFDKPGIEFSLTYFDNPGLNVPSSLTLWVTVTGMPDYLKKLRQAALGVAKRRGNTPSVLANKNNMCSSDLTQANSNVMQSSSTAILMESLRATLFLF